MQLACTLAIVLGFTRLLQAEPTPVAAAPVKIALCSVCLLLVIAFARWVGQLRRLAPGPPLSALVDQGETWHARFYLAAMVVIFLPLDLARIAHANWGLAAFGGADEVFVVSVLSAPLVLSWYLMATETSSAVAIDRWRHVSLLARHLLALPLIPLFTLLTVGGVIRRLAPGAPPWLEGLLGGTVLLLLLVYLPGIVRRSWVTRPLPGGPVQRRVTEVLSRANVRIAQILLWDTGGTLANAAVTGILPQFRYLLLTDELVRRLTPDQVAAIAAHEAAHCRHHHLPRLASTLLVPMLALILLRRLPDESLAGWSVGLTASQEICGVMVAWAGLFRYWSRLFEHQADLTACQLISGSNHLEPAAVGQFVESLIEICPLTTGDWLHPAPARRLQFLTDRLADPALIVAFERRVDRHWRCQLIAIAVLAAWAVALA